MPYDRAMAARLKALLSNSELFPDEFKAWVNKGKEDPIQTYQLPAPENMQSVAATVGFQNGWVDFGAPFPLTRFFKDLSGVVHLTGMVKNGTLNSTAFTMPVGYRPSGTLRFAALDGVAGPAFIDIQTSGIVQVRFGSSNVSFSIFCVYRAEA